MWGIQKNKNGHLVLARDTRPTVTLNKAPGCDSLPTPEAKKHFATHIARAMNAYESREIDSNESAPDVVPFFWLPILVFGASLFGALFGAWVVLP